MTRIEPYLGVLVAMVFVFLITNSPDTAGRPTRAPSQTATSSTVAVISSDTASDSTTGVIADVATSVKPKPEKTVNPKPAATAVVETPVVASVSSPALSVSDNTDLNAAATTLRNALVNILCYAPAGGPLRSVSGSGVFITSSGIILTNAHIAQNFLLADRGVSCRIRSGSPAIDSYEASLVFISPKWIAMNANILTDILPSGTGEGDFALLAITKNITRTPLPETFPFIAPAVSQPNNNTPVVIASYGAQFLQTNQVQFSLFPTVVFGSIKDLFTFATNTVDVIALGGSAAAQEGSSGGGVANANGELIGTITTSTVTGDTSTRSLDAITLSYIRADYASETGSPLDVLLAAPTTNSIAAFAPQITGLETILTAHLP